MKFTRTFVSLSMSSAIVMLSACNVSTQDEGLGSEGTPISGIAVDGYIARGVVFADGNENNKLDPWERRALTDSQGYFSYNPNSDINYCSLPSTDPKSVHCLKAPLGFDDVLIRITRGYDLTTVEPFTGTLSMRVNIASSVIEVPAMGGPLNTLLAEMASEQQSAFFEAETSIDQNSLQHDYLNFATGNGLQGADDDRKAIIKLSIDLHKISDIIAASLDKVFATANGDSSGFFGAEQGLPVDASTYVYQAIVDEIFRLQTTTDLSSLFNDQTRVENVVQSAFANMSEVVDIYNNRQSSSGDHYQLPTTLVTTDILNAVSAYITLSDLVYQGALDSADLEGDVKARMRAGSIVADLYRSQQATAAQAAITAVSDTSQASNSKTYMQNLRSAKVDVALIKQKFIDGTYAVEDSNFDARTGFAELLANGGNTGISGSNAEGFAGNTLSLGTDADAVGVNFVGDTSDATSGTMTIDANFAEGDFEGQNELTGTWEQLDEYTMLMNVEVAGVIEPVIIKPSLNENGDTVYNFDLGGEQQNWTPE